MTRDEAERVIAGVQRWEDVASWKGMVVYDDVLRALEALPSVDEMREKWIDLECTAHEERVKSEAAEAELAENEESIRNLGNRLEQAVQAQDKAEADVKRMLSTVEAISKDANIWMHRASVAEAELANAEEALCDKQRDMLKWIARAEEAEAKASVLSGEWCAENRARGAGGCGACAWCCKQATDRAEKNEAELANAKKELHQARMEWHEEKRRALELEAELARVPARLREAFEAGEVVGNQFGSGLMSREFAKAEAARFYPDKAGEDQQHTDMPETDGHGFRVPPQPSTTLTTTCPEDRSDEISFSDDDNPAECPVCHGKGQYPQIGSEHMQIKCQTCDGTGSLGKPAEEEDIVRMFDGEWTREQYDDLRTLARRIAEPLEKRLDQMCEAAHVKIVEDALYARISLQDERLERDADILQVQRGMLNNLDGAYSEIKAKFALLDEWSALTDDRLDSVEETDLGLDELKARLSKLEAVGADILAQNIADAVDRIHELEGAVDTHIHAYHDELEERSYGK